MCVHILVERFNQQIVVCAVIAIVIVLECDSAFRCGWIEVLYPVLFFSKLTYPIVFFITNTKHSWLRFCFIVSKYPTDLRITILWGTRELASETQTHTWHRTNTRHQILAWNRRVIIYICTRSKRENQRDLFEA